MQAMLGLRQHGMLSLSQQIFREGTSCTFIGVDGSPQAPAQGGQATLVCPIVQVSIRQLIQIDAPPLVPRCLTWLDG